jgi:hypothetical protein
MLRRIRDRKRRKKRTVLAVQLMKASGQLQQQRLHTDVDIAGSPLFIILPSGFCDLSVDLRHLRLQPARGKVVLHHLVEALEIGGAPDGVLQHRIHQMVPRGAPVGVRERVLRMVAVAEERAVE